LAHRTGVRRLALVFALVVSLASAAFASNLRFIENPAPINVTDGAHADLNGDGREDFARVNYVDGGFYVALSLGDGHWAQPVQYTLSGSADANIVLIGDFNGDEKPDLVVAGREDKAFHLFLNNGFGRFSEKAVLVNGVLDSGAATVGDFNHDGRMDIAFVGPSETSVIVWFGNGKGGFTVGPTTPVSGGEHCDSHLQMADFDGDGRADLICDGFDTLNETVLFGDGSGRFPASSVVPTSSNQTAFYLADVDGDGKMDVLATQSIPLSKTISVHYGSATRKWTRTATIPTLQFARAVAAADMNGDGINDLIVGEIDPAYLQYVDVLLRNSDGSYQKEQTIAFGGSDFEFHYVARLDWNTTPDLVLDTYVLRDTTVGNFPSCVPPSVFERIHVCSPAAGATVTSPVAFKAGAAGQVAMRDMEVWVDGKKVALQLDGFSHYTFLNRSVSLAKGTHNVAIFAAGWDQSLQKKTFALTVK
jgi:hypothetical protein